MELDKKKDLNVHCRNMRLNMLRLTYGLGKRGAHIASSLSVTEILAVLFLEHMNLVSDTFILSKGHAGLAYYVGMYEAGLITQDELDTFDMDGGDFPGQPSKNSKYGIVFSSGSLGMGLSYGVGCALGNRKKGINAGVYCVLGDGECNEGTIWESAMLAKQLQIDNLTAIVDWNYMQSDGNTKDILSIDLEAMWKACGWKTIVTDGHDAKKLAIALNTSHKGVPLVILAKTIKGKGVSFMENQKAWHHGNLTKEQYESASREVLYGIQ